MLYNAKFIPQFMISIHRLAFCLLQIHAVDTRWQERAAAILPGESEPINLSV